ncbi:NADH dehydrogenase [ubiquinone] iron-sulfur protein 4, mitochondrial [Copidosoma floridanum]|uniref:NADH dehydrogenase [ubiquinone] iron-sulfur protein 4, mitochondrial n=1 Tax=Copidosoma floridanum TaxID=29053 RepID=UPI0006C993D5|nr:NADH dehydrogenase [ubiquinone] iron-sulfur protein 4, mitochondrial [Copidosoma floridanum]
MGSKALLIRNVNRIINNSSQCKYLSSTSTLSRASKSKDEKSVEVYKPLRESLHDVMRGREQIQHDKDLNNYITIESELDAVGICSGVPEEHIKTRTVRIYMPSKNAMQSGIDNTHHWQICFDTRERWENPLMGWCSSGDPLQATRVNFPTQEDAIRHCENMGWNYFVQQPNENNPKPRTYGANFSWDKRTRVSTK